MNVDTLRRVVLHDDTPAGRTFDLVIQALIVLSLAAFSVQTLPDLSSFWRTVLRSFEIFTVVVFSVEYVLRVVLTRPTHAYVFSFFGLIDLLAILPFYLSLGGLDLRSVRALRLFRLVRVLKLARYSRALDHFRKAFLTKRAEFVIFFVACVLIIYFASVGIYYFEREAQPEAFGSVFSSMWWAVATLTTVGYGDVYPITIGGRLFTTAILFVGLSIISVPAGLVASALTEVLRMDREAQQADSDTPKNPSQPV